jgi:hypothetical protein
VAPNPGHQTSQRFNSTTAAFRRGNENSLLTHRNPPTSLSEHLSPSSCQGSTLQLVVRRGGRVGAALPSACRPAVGSCCRSSSLLCSSLLCSSLLSTSSHEARRSLCGVVVCPSLAGHHSLLQTSQCAALHQTFGLVLLSPHLLMVATCHVAIGVESHTLDSVKMSPCSVSPKHDAAPCMIYWICCW